MRWAILMYGLGISGGANVIFEHALYAMKKGVDITFISLTRQGPEATAWHKGTDGFNYRTLDDINDEYDVAIATEWRSAFDCYKVKAKKYIYFVQSIESRFFKNQDSMLAYVANCSYELDYYYITEATWIKKYLKDKYHKEASLVLNGIDKKIFKINYGLKKRRKKVRFLVEGSIKNWLKNVPRTIELCRKAGAEEIWLVTPDDITNYPGVSVVYSRMPIEKMPTIYSSCDVLVKLSLVEGMFGPPLEMFHCGGTAIVYDIEGSEEYIKNNYNAVVVKKNDENGVVNAIRQLKNDPGKVKELKKNALETAKKWIDWDKSSGSFYDCVTSFSDMTSNVYSNLVFKAGKGAIAYRKIESVFAAEIYEDRIKKAVRMIREKELKLFIFGAGLYCKSTIILFLNAGVEVSGILVSDKLSNPGNVFGYSVMNINEIESDRKSCLVFLSVSKHRENIAACLKETAFDYVV